jgi:hypothetical protein
MTSKRQLAKVCMQWPVVSPIQASHWKLSGPSGLTSGTSELKSVQLALTTVG